MKRAGLAPRPVWPNFSARHPAGEMVGPNGNAAYARIERTHLLLQGFTDTSLLPFAEHYLPLQPVANPVLTVIPPYPAFPPEMVYPKMTHTDQPAVVLAEKGGARLVYLPGDIDRSFWRSQNPDLRKLLTNAIRWLVPDTPVLVEGDGLAELFAWQTKAGHAVHVLNYGNPELLRGWFDVPYALGPQKVTLTLPAGSAASAVELLRAGLKPEFKRTEDRIEFTIPRVRDYEVAAIS